MADKSYDSGLVPGLRSGEDWVRASAVIEPTLHQDFQLPEPASAAGMVEYTVPINADRVGVFEVSTTLQLQQAAH